jgi:hypothetical protein
LPRRRHGRSEKNGVASRRLCLLAMTGGRGGACAIFSLQLSNSPTHITADARHRSASTRRRAAVIHFSSPKALERACGTSSAVLFAAAGACSWQHAHDHPRTGHGQLFTSAFRTRRITGLPLPAAPRLAP